MSDRYVRSLSFDGHGAGGESAGPRSVATARERALLQRPARSFASSPSPADRRGEGEGPWHGSSGCGTLRPALKRGGDHGPYHRFDTSRGSL